MAEPTFTLNHRCHHCGCEYEVFGAGGVCPRCRTFVLFGHDDDVEAELARELLKAGMVTTTLSFGNVTIGSTLIQSHMLPPDRWERWFDTECSIVGPDYVDTEPSVHLRIPPELMDRFLCSWNVVLRCLLNHWVQCNDEHSPLPVLNLQSLDDYGAERVKILVREIHRTDHRRTSLGAEEHQRRIREANRVLLTTLRSLYIDLRGPEASDTPIINNKEEDSP